MDAAVEFIKKSSTRYLMDTLGFEKHMRQIRERRGDHVPDAWYRRPYFYSMFLDSEKIKGHGETVTFPSYVEQPDYELEMVGCFLKPFRTTSVDEAVDFIKHNMVFTIFNDLSARDLQAQDMALPLSVSASKGVADKSFGPVWVHGNSLPFDANGIPDVGVRLSVNGEVRCEDRFGSIYFNDPISGARRCWGFAQVIAWFGGLNQRFEAGHLLGSGTVGNCSIMERSDHYPWLKGGDVIRMEIEGIGVLENTVAILEMPRPSKSISEG